MHLRVCRMAAILQIPSKFSGRWCRPERPSNDRSASRIEAHKDEAMVCRPQQRSAGCSAGLRQGEQFMMKSKQAALAGCPSHKRLTRRLFHGAVFLAATLYLLGCRNTASQAPPAARSTQPQQFKVPTPPSADQISPSSPRAVLDGTSTTQPATQPAPSPRR